MAYRSSHRKLNSNEEEGQRAAQIGTYGGLEAFTKKEFSTKQTHIKFNLIFYSNLMLGNRTVKWSRTLLLSPFCFLPCLVYLNINQILIDESELRIRRVYWAI